MTEVNSKNIDNKTCVRKQIDSKINSERGYYEYTYEIYKNDQLVGTKKTTVKMASNNNIKFDEEKHLQTIIDLCNKYFEENQIKIVTLFKGVNLKKHLKDLCKFILDEKQIVIFQFKLKELIQRHILKNRE